MDKLLILSGKFSSGSGTAKQTKCSFETAMANSFTDKKRLQCNEILNMRAINLSYDTIRTKRKTDKKTSNAIKKKKLMKKMSAQFNTYCMIMYICLLRVLTYSLIALEFV